MKKAISIILLVALLAATLTVASANNDSSLAIESPELSQFLALAEAQKDAVAAHEVLYSSFLSDNSVLENFPENYGGDYIEDNLLHICIVDLPTQDLTPYKTLLADYLDIVVFEDVKHSLELLLNSSYEIASSLNQEGISIVSYGVSESNNSVTIGYNPNNATHLNTFEANPSQEENYVLSGHNYDVPVIFTEEATPKNAVAIDLVGGSPLHNLTLGACGYYGGEPAIATCGHSLALNDIVYYQPASIAKVIGPVTAMRFEDGGSGDYAISPITADTSFNITNLVGDPSDSSELYEITTSITRPASGTALIKYGKVSKFAYGTVSSSYEVEAEDGSTTDLTVKNLVKVSISSGIVKKGDSGGPVFTSSGSFCGVLSGAVFNNSEMIDGDRVEYATETYYFSPYQYLRNDGFSVTVG